MIQCKELSGKVVQHVILYDDGAHGPEVYIQFADGTAFSAWLRTHATVEAQYIRDQGGEPTILRDYSTPILSRRA